jgi:hypothetical protein
MNHRLGNHLIHCDQKRFQQERSKWKVILEVLLSWYCALQIHSSRCHSEQGTIHTSVTPAAGGDSAKVSRMMGSEIHEVVA